MSVVCTDGSQECTSQSDKLNDELVSERLQSEKTLEIEL